MTPRPLCRADRDPWFPIEGPRQHAFTPEQRYWFEIDEPQGWRDLEPLRSRILHDGYFDVDLEWTPRHRAPDPRRDELDHEMLALLAAQDLLLQKDRTAWRGQVKARALEDSQALTRAKVAERREAKLARREATMTRREAKLELRARRSAEILERETKAKARARAEAEAQRKTQDAIRQHERVWQEQYYAEEERKKAAYHATLRFQADREARLEDIRVRQLAQLEEARLLEALSAQRLEALSARREAIQPEVDRIHSAMRGWNEAHQEGRVTGEAWREKLAELGRELDTLRPWRRP